MDYMSRAIALARRASGSTSPNPAVGAVIVKDGTIVGEGYTQPPGSYHAEIVALHKAGARAQGATLYVSLEPCCHWGRTPPCTRAIIASGIKEVHIAMLDPNPLVKGKGQQELEEAGIKTYAGKGKSKGLEVNEAYIKYISTGQPFVIAKFAMSLDGKIATRAGDSKWITCENSRRMAHLLRRQVDAVLVGVGTVIADDPLLTARNSKGRPYARQPLRIVLDSNGRIPPRARLFGQPGETIIAVREDLESSAIDRLLKLRARILKLPVKESFLDIKTLLKTLGQQHVLSILVEGGSAVLGNFFDERVVDKVMAFVAPVIVGGKGAKTAVGGLGIEFMAQALHLERTRIQIAKGDIIVTGYIRY